jgi:FkbM family methyltransferase
MNPASRAAVYVRVMSRELDPALEREEQRRRLTEFVQAQSWELAGVYEDTGPDALPVNMTALQEALESSPGLDRLVVLRLDRLGTRSPRRVESILNRLRDAGCALVSLEDSFDTGEESGRAVEAIVSAFAAGAPRPWVCGGWDRERLADRGFSPATIIDVGAADGTRPLYRAFPDAYRVLIEPLAEFEPDLRSLASSGGEYLATAVGAVEGTVTLAIPDNLRMTSALPAVEELPLTSSREVPVTTLDSLLESRNWTPPFGLKIDVEGFEHEVIEGASRLLGETQFVIPEVSITRRFRGERSCAELIEMMGVRGFEVCDVLDAGRSLLGIHADLLFRRSAAG